MGTLPDVSDPQYPLTPSRMPRWVWAAVGVFWLGYLVAVRLDRSIDGLYGLFVLLLLSLFLSLAIEPGVNRLERRGWKRGSATLLFLLGTLVIVILFLVAISAQVGQQLADLLSDSEKYVTRTVNFLNDNLGTRIDPSAVITEIEDPNGAVQTFISNQRSKVIDLSVTALGVLLQTFSVLLFTFYLVADAPKLRRLICSRLRHDRQERLMHTWEIAIDKTGGYLYSRALLAGASAIVHWIALSVIGAPAPLAMALWVGAVSQFLPVVGTYIAGALPVLITFIDSPSRALAVVIVILVYQQFENYVIAPRVTARTMDLHPAVAFGAALAGAAILGPVGAVLAIPGAAMLQAVLSDRGIRFGLIDHPLLESSSRLSRRQRRAAAQHPGTRGHEIDGNP
ncbi:MAG: hypothetical protein RLZ04_244 [Actinomycetota bacterium]